MNWPWKTEKPKAWSPPGSGWADMLAVPVPDCVKVLRAGWEYRAYLADRVQWMLDESGLDLSYFLSLVEDAGENMAWVSHGYGLEEAGEQLILSTVLMDDFLSQTVPSDVFPAKMNNLDPNHITLVSETGIEEWLENLVYWAAAFRVR